MNDFKKPVVLNSSENYQLEDKTPLVVNWKDNYSGIIYPARYVLTVTKEEGKYLITKISPFAYIPEDSQS